MTIKEIYGCQYISSEELFPLQKWYNNLIDKNIDDLSIADVLKMIRQKVFMDIAISKSIEFLKRDPFAGELYEGQLLEKISQISDSEINKYHNELQQIVSIGLVQNEKYDWITEDEREEFRKVLNICNRKFKN